MISAIISWRPSLIGGIAASLVLAYILFASLLAIRQHDSFHTHAFDMAYFDNVMWNTSQGRLFVNDFPDKPRIFLGEHFSPALIMLVPLYWLWPDPRALLVAQAVALALSVVPCYLLVRRRYPRLAHAVMLSLYLNPALLGVALSEFHEIALAAPLLSWALYALVAGEGRGKLVGMLVGLLGALLVKEEVAVIVAAVGIYFLLSAHRTSHIAHRKSQSVLGIALVAVAFAWLAFVWGVLPTFLADAVSHWQLRYGDIAPTPWQGAQRLLADPAFLIARYASPQKFAAVARVLWPLAFLPLHAPSLIALALPVVAYLLLSNKASVSQLQFWYVTPILPILFVATAAAIGNAPPRRAQWLTLALFVASVLGYLWLGAGPFAANDEPARFAVTERTECGQRLLALVPPDASLSAQDNLMPHLAQRHNVWVFPSMGEPLADFVALDTRYEFAGGYSNWPTVRPLEVPAVVNRFLSQPAYDLVGDGCDYKILRHSDAPTIPRARAQLFGQQIAMLGYEVAVADERGIYHSGLGTWDMGRSLRVIVWWQSVGHMLQDYTVFVHALDARGRVVGQHDSPPANGFRPTSQWNDGETVRDIHYFTLDDDAMQIEVGLYDARTGRRLLLGDGGDAVNVTRDK